MFFLKRGVFLEKKSPRQGCTTQITELGMHQNPHFQLNPSKNQINPEINPKTAGKKHLFTSLNYFWGIVDFTLIRFIGGHPGSRPAWLGWSYWNRAQILILDICCP